MSTGAAWLRHRRLACAIAANYFLPGADRDDVEQEALIGLWKAARYHDPARGPFPPFAALVIRRHLDTRVRLANGLRQQPLTAASRVLDQGREGGHTTEQIAEARERVRDLARHMHSLTVIERHAVTRCLNGDGPASKQDDNALWRAKKKLKELMPA